MGRVEGGGRGDGSRSVEDRDSAASERDGGNGARPSGSSTVPAEPVRPEAFGRADEENHGGDAGDARRPEPVDYQKPAPSKRPFYKRPVLMVVLGAVLLVLIGVGVWYLIYSAKYESTDDAFIDAHITTVSPQVAGNVIDVLANDNQFVHAGDVVVRIDDRDFNVALSSSQAALLAAQGKLLQAQAMEKVAEAQAASSRADVETARANATNAASDLERYNKLDPRAYSRQAKDNAVAAAHSTEATLQANQKKAEAADAQVGLARTQIETAKADVQTANVSVDNARLQLSYATVSAPISGWVTRRSVEKGSYVAVGQALFMIVPETVYVTANFKETQLTHMRPGDGVDIEVDAFPGRSLHGKLDSIQAGSGARFSTLPPENATGNYVKVVQRVPVKIDFDSGQNLEGLTPGLSAEPKVWTKR